jgi:hypothetical protein
MRLLSSQEAHQAIVQSLLLFPPLPFRTQRAGTIGLFGGFVHGTVTQPALGYEDLKHLSFSKATCGMPYANTGEGLSERVWELARILNEQD